MSTWPPVPDAPWPTVIYKDPPDPDSAEPDPKNTDPLLPMLAVPVLNTIDPLTPDVPALDVNSDMLPLVEALLYPLTTLTAPPVDMDDRPAEIAISPPTPLSPLPTVT